MDGITILGLVAATAINVAFVPQFIKSLKTKKTNDLSYSMYIVYIGGILMWLVYGIITKQIAIILEEVFGLILVIPVFYLKIKYG
ncbi:MAG: MtN3 and saliva related transrane protein [Patescibacteria group bacterium]|nr:MtN3 and saliva related transrane protein [Patescibacteria group bacterium]